MENSIVAKPILGAVRKIQMFSNAQDERVDCRKEYWFHHWLTPRKALIEDESGKLLAVKWEGNFSFNDRVS